MIRLIAASSLLLSAALSAQTMQPVRVGLNGPDLDGCGSSARVVGLKKGGDNFLSVRAAPSTKARETRRLSIGQVVLVCDSAAKGQWLGIVFDPSGKIDDCKVNSPIARVQNYRGPCASGWVSAKFIEVFAG